ncbi:MAG TPA: hypothetical protein VJ981_00225 [Gammaproteobacteria bacterium]|nr:hypothetical protein [Gammaproteobacteria bacterium]
MIMLILLPAGKIGNVLVSFGVTQHWRRFMILVSMEWQPPDDIPGETPPSEFPPEPPEQEPPVPEEVPPPPKEIPDIPEKWRVAG